MTQPTYLIELEVELKNAKGFKLDNVVSFLQCVDTLEIHLDNEVTVTVPDEKIDGLSWKVVDQHGEEAKVRSTDFIVNRFSHTD